MSTSSAQNDKHSRWLTQAQIALGWAIVLLLLGSVGALYLGQVSRTALLGSQALELENDLHVLSDENRIIEQAIAAATSIGTMERRAREMGLEFVRPKPDEIEYLNTTVYISPSAPISLATEAETVSLPMPPATMSSALLIAIQDNFMQLFQGESRANR